MENESKSKNIILLLVVVCIIGVSVFVLLNKNNGGSSSSVTPSIKKTEYTMSGNSLENFDLYFLKLENGKENKIYSPLSIKYALEMLAQGASGESKSQISSILGTYEARKYTNSENMSFANAFFVRNSFKESVKEDYINTIRNKFSGEVVFDNFENASTINGWVKDKTLNLLDNLVSDDTVKSLDFALVNALAIDMEWQHKFLEPIDWHVGYAHEKINQDENNASINWMADTSLRRFKFENINEDISGMGIQASFNRYDIVKELGEDNIKQTVFSEFKKYAEQYSDYECLESKICEGKKYSQLSDNELNQVFEDYFKSYLEGLNANYNKSGYNTDFELYADDNVKVFAKDLKEYNGTTLQYVGIMPTNVDLDSYISNLNAEKVNGILGNLKELKLESFKDGVLTRVIGSIPKFKFDYSLDLLNDLKKLGVTNIFDINKADLSNLTDSKEYISCMIHKANIEFTQDGIKASAATIAGGAGAAGSFDYLFEIPVEVIDLTFDKPYMFIIRDKSTGEVWFAGTVYSPMLYSQDTTRSY